MDFEQFKEQFVEDVQKVLQDRELNVNLDTHLINKPNEQYESLTVTPVESRIGVNLTMDRFYEAY